MWYGVWGVGCGVEDIGYGVWGMDLIENLLDGASKMLSFVFETCMLLRGLCRVCGAKFVRD